MKNEIELNFSFLDKFVKLPHTKIEKSLSLGSIRSFIRALENPRETMYPAIIFKFRGNEFIPSRNRLDYDEDEKIITKEHCNKFYLRFGKPRLRDVNLEQVVAYFENTEIFLKIQAVLAILVIQIKRDRKLSFFK